MKVFKDKAFDEFCGDQIAYGFYGRKGGVSAGIYAALNCSRASNDAPEAVEQNRSIVAKDLGVSGAEISTPWQCHSADCLLIDRPYDRSNRPNGDALATDVAGVPVGILTADCGPVLFVGAKDGGAPVIAAAHAGWGGALGGVLEDTVAKMGQLGAALQTVKACLGPCIAQASYEVQDGFAAPFLERHEEAERFFLSARKVGHLMFDLAGYIAFRLSLAGVRHVSIMGIDTYAEEEGCFSYRRATHRGEADYGRQLSAIVING